MRFCVPLLLLSIVAAAEARPAAKQAKPAIPLQAQPVGAAAYVLMDVDTGRVLAARHEHKRMFPASTTKTMTALVAIEQGNLDQVFRIGPNPPLTGEQSAYLIEGEQIRLRDLVRAAMIKSANDSCVAIAEAVGGTVPNFARLMNEKAKEVGARNTHFVNPHGLHDPQHYTTAYDLALIARAAMRHPFFNETVKTKEAWIQGNYKMRGQRLLVNKNKLLFRWAACDGVKTGYTKQAGRCLIASATRINPATKKPWRLVSVVLRSPDTFNDSANLLLHKGFQAYRPVSVIGAGQVMASIPVQGGARSARAVTSGILQMPLHGDERSTLTHRVQVWNPIAPVARGQRLGYLVFTASGRKIGKVELVAQEAVEPSLVARMVPAAGPIIPSNPILRYLVYAMCSLGLLLIFAGMQVRAHERSRSRLRRTKTPVNSINYRPPAGYRPPRSGASGNRSSSSQSRR